MDSDAVVPSGVQIDSTSIMAAAPSLNLSSLLPPPFNPFVYSTFSPLGLLRSLLVFVVLLVTLSMFEYHALYLVVKASNLVVQF